jgi:hypothetical protein
MTTFLAVYRGKTISDAKLVGVSINPQLVRLVARRMTKDEAAPEKKDGQDVALGFLAEGRTCALEAIAAEEPIEHRQQEGDC